MNNVVEILYSKSDKYPQIFINGEQISRYMELSDLIYDDIFNWASRMYESVDDELAEAYSIKLVGHPFHHEVLKAVKPISQYCTEISFSNIEYKIPLSDKFVYALKINDQYSLTAPLAGGRVTFGCGEPEKYQAIVPYAAGFTKESGNYYITDSGEFPENCGKYCVTLSDKVGFERKHGVSYITVTAELLPLLVDYLNIYHIRMDFINAVFAAAQEKKLDDESKLEFEAFSKEEYRVMISDIPEKMECGEMVTVTYKVFPACFDDPHITVSTGDANVIAFSYGNLVANGAGNCTVKVADKFGNEYLSKSICVEKHNYISNISIILPATTMRIDETLRFKCIMTPSDAEDIGNVHYSVSNESVAVLSSPNELYALAAGRVCVTVSTPRVSRKIYVTVLPRAYDVALPGESLELPINAEAEIYCSVVPMNASPMPTAVWTTSDVRVIRIIGANDFGCKIQSEGFGTATLTCRLNGTDIQRSMRIDVPKPKGCYIATAVYGSYDCPEVWTLRRYRDNYLSAHWFGRAFIKVYYALSPKVVDMFGDTKWFNRLWKGFLDKKVEGLRKKGYEDTPYRD